VRKWVWIVAGVAAVAVGVFVAVMVARESQQLKADYAEYSGTYVAAATSDFARRGDSLVLRSDGTWTLSSRGKVVDKGGEATDVPGHLDVKKLNWLGPSGTEKCLGSVDDECGQPTFSDDWSGDLVYVPTLYRQTTNKGDWETSGYFYKVTDGGRVLVDEYDTRWVRRTERVD
jgi:hypothetical protein